MDSCTSLEKSCRALNVSNSIFVTDSLSNLSFYVISLEKIDLKTSVKASKKAQITKLNCLYLSLELEHVLKELVQIQAKQTSVLGKDA